MPGTPIKRAKRQKAQELMQSPDFWEQLWVHLGEGHSLRSFTGDGSIVPYSVLFDRIQKDPELNEKYELVRNARALANAERVEELATKVELGQIDPHAAKVSVGARQ